MLRVGTPLVAAFCGGALSGCGSAPPPTPAPPPTSLETAWENHFDAFGAGVGSKKDTPERTAALDKIMKDYDENSIVSIWYAANHDKENCQPDFEPGETCKLTNEMTSLKNIKSMFDTLFNDLQGCADTKDGLKFKVDLSEPVGSAPGSVFLVWDCKKMRFQKATDTFVFDGAMIRKQNIVIEMSPPTSQGLRQPVSLSQGLLAQDDYKPINVTAAWKNHFQAFGKGANGGPNDPHTEALDMIMKDYTEESVVHIAVYEKGATEIPNFVEHAGMTKIRKMFKDLFDDIDDPCNLGAPLAEVTGDVGSAAKQVFLVWRIPASTVEWATDTFVFDDNFKIIKQNIVSVRADPNKDGCPTSIVV